MEIEEYKEIYRQAFDYHKNNINPKREEDVVKIVDSLPDFDKQGDKSNFFIDLVIAVQNELERVYKEDMKDGKC